MKNNKVKIIDKKSTFIDKSVRFGKNVVVYPNNTILGRTFIEDNAVIMPNNYINNSKIGKNTIIEFSYIEDSEVGINSKIGPFSRLRPKSYIGSNCKIGNFVEIKNSTLGDGCKASHLAYVGDATIGQNCNIGCGAIFVNYNGKQKHRSIVGNSCFIGSNVNVIAPVNLSDNTYVCAGTTITKNTNKNDFVIGRAREEVKQNYSKKYSKEG